MRILTLKLGFFLLFILAVDNFSVCAQIQKTTVTQDEKFVQMLRNKTQNAAKVGNDAFFKIQLFSGPIEEAKPVLSSVRQEFKQLEATIVFTTPNYKVWLGNFKYRIDAERVFIDVKKSYPNALIIKPKK